MFVTGALDAIQDELRTITALKKKSPSELAISLPGIEDSLLRDTERQLLRFKRGLERLLPEKRRAAFGL